MKFNAFLSISEECPLIFLLPVLSKPSSVQAVQVPRTVSKAAVSEDYALDLDLQNFQLDPKRLADTVGQWQRLSVHGCAVVELLKGMGAEDAAVLLRALAERCQERFLMSPVGYVQ